MADWTTPANGNWSDAARWTGGVPNAAGATANFTVPNPGNATVLVSFSQNANFTVGTLNVTTDSDQGWTFQGEAGVTSATLRFQGAGGGPAFLNTDTNDSSRVSSISDANGMKVTLASDLIVTTADSATAFEIRAPITGAFDVYKFGGGTLRVSGGNAAMTGDYFLNGGRTELTSANGVGGGSLITINNGATLASVNTFTLGNNLETASGNKIGIIAAKVGTTLTLTGEILLRSSNVDAVTFGSVADTGTIVLSGTSSIAGAGGFHVGGGALRFGNAGAAANYFSSMSTNGIVSAGSGGVLDTGGFAATIDNLVLGGGGTLQSNTGALNVTSDHSLVAANLSGSVVGTAQADRLVFNVANDINLNGLTFSSWTNGTDTITINGNGNFNILVGTTRNDIINGGGGGDTLLGGGGVDTIRGGTGDDTYIIADAQSILIENAGEGNDTVLVSGGVATFTLATNFENLTFQGSAQHVGIGNTADNVLTGGTGSDELRGLEGNDALLGDNGADTLDGGTGNDILTGGAGDDVLVVDSAGDVVVEIAGGGNDRVLALASYTLTVGAAVELLSAQNQNGTTALDLTGNDLASTIIGNEGANSLDGRGGNDVIFALGGNDLLDGGTGNDFLAGGTGDDIYLVDSAGDVVVEDAGGGNDRVLVLANYKLAAGAEVELLSAADQNGAGALDLTGNDLASTIIGNEGANTLDGRGGNDVIFALGGNDVLDGGAGNDFLVGGAGDDAFVVDSAGDIVVEDVGGGSDRVLAMANYTLAAGAEIELFSAQNQAGTSALDLTGNDFASTMIGNDGANTLDGRGGNDTIYGLGGADLIDGGAGNDFLLGGAGADNFRFSTALGGNVDTIADFLAVDDTIALDDAIFTALSLGALNPAAFVTGTAAQDADDRIIYNGATGALLYDADGNGASAAVQFAALSGAPVITASDFLVI